MFFGTRRTTLEYSISLRNDYVRVDRIIIFMVYCIAVPLKGYPTVSLTVRICDLLSSED